MAKHSLFVSEVQLVKFYSDRKLVASLSSYTGLDSARPIKVQWLVGIWLQEELQPPFQAFSASDSKAHRLGVSSASDPIRIVAPCLGPYTKHKVFASGSALDFVGRPKTELVPLCLLKWVPGSLRPCKSHMS